MALNPPVTRRRLIANLAGASLYAFVGHRPPALAARGGASERKLVFVLLRGAADGLSLMAPVGDPQFGSVRGELAEEDGRHPIDSFFSLHPGLATIASLARERQTLLFHAVGLSHASRSHFDAQNLLETGGSTPYGERTGVLNRLLPLADARPSGLALSHAIPPALIGPNASSSFSPLGPDRFDADLYDRIGGMYDGAMPHLGRTWREAVATRKAGGDFGAGTGTEPENLGQLAAGFLTQADGPQVLMIESLGWDTHSNQRRRLDGLTRSLDGMIASLKKHLGPAWRDTLVIVASEFGRTVRANGSSGSDHGTANALFALGGALPRTGIIADWPGLATSSLHEGRDLRTTRPVEAVLAALAGAHFAVEPGDAARLLYPALPGLEPLALA